jgi:tRNA dimethylallyltransferase
MMISWMTKSLVVVAGPTAVGKTAAGIELAKEFKTEIISADSRQIYRETRIGTAVPTPDELRTVPHHFIQSVSLASYYNASMYEVEVLDKLDILFKRHDTVIMVGGSGLYIDAVCFGIDDLPNINQEIRTQLMEKFNSEGIDSIRRDLKKLDPLTYDRVDLNNHYRILKALEVTIQTGKPYSSFLTHSKKRRDFRIIRLGLDMEREVLYKRINDRVDKMIDDGLTDEVKNLIHFRGENAMKTVGYREIFSYLDNKISLEEAVDLVKRNTRRYARKQLTWFRKDQIYPWFHPEEQKAMIDFIHQEINKLQNDPI